MQYANLGFDIKALAETGSGKTGAFMIPIIQVYHQANNLFGERKRLFKFQKILFTNENANQGQYGAKPAPLALIIEPTRELTLQVHEQGRKFASGMQYMTIAISYRYLINPLSFFLQKLA